MSERLPLIASTYSVARVGRKVLKNSATPSPPVHPSDILFLDGNMSRAFLPFEIEGNAFLIETNRVREILGQQSLTQIPHGSKRLPGVFAHKGLAIPVIDLAAVLDLTAQARSEDQSKENRRRTIVIQVGDDVAALVVDEVWEVSQIPEKELKEVRLTPRAFAQMEVQWSQQVATVLDIESMVHACMQGESGA